MAERSTDTIFCEPCASRKEKPLTIATKSACEQVLRNTGYIDSRILSRTLSATKVTTSSKKQVLLSAMRSDERYALSAFSGSAS